ncbi:MAG: hypothetical protein ACHRXM_06030 [Isosphaerales bacterium]
MIKWCGTVLGAVVLALSTVTPAWAQGAAKPAEPPGMGLFTLTVLFAPALVVILFLLLALRRFKRNMRQIERSLEMAEESLLLSRERVALQKETNRLLGKLIEAVSRD